MEKNIVNILHISDIHFGMESAKNITQSAQRKNSLDELLATVSSLNQSEKPHLVVVSGDITWQGSKEGFSSAKVWLNQLLSKLSLTFNDLIFCAGNHDLDRKKTFGLGLPTSSSEADQWLSIENLENLERPFKNYIDFSIDLGIPPLIINEEDNYLVGHRKIHGINFIVLNSAWFCRGRDDVRKLWIGLPQLELMNASRQIMHNKENESNITIAVIHHPISWLNEEEQSTYNERPATYRYLSERCQLILSGHTHGTIENATRVFDQAYYISGGAAYAGGRFRNNFSIIKINTKDSLAEQVPFEYEPRNNRWDRKIAKNLFLISENERNEKKQDKYKNIDKDDENGIEQTDLIWNIPYRQHPFFIGRDIEIREIRDLLQPQENTQKMITIIGMGGIGKSQLAIEYSYFYEKLYKVVWWVRAEESVTIIADYEELCTKLGLVTTNQNGESVCLESIFKWMAQNEDWLIIFDNATSKDDLINYIPFKHKGHILITSRNPNWIINLSLELLESEKSIEFLIKSTNQDDYEAASELSEELGDLPLALEQASAYIRESGLSLHEYLDRFRTHRSYIVSKGTPLNYSSTIATTWELSFQKVCQDIPACRDFMIFCSFLFPELISKKIFVIENEVFPEFIKPLINNSLEFDDLISKLRSFSLIQISPQGFTIHRLIQLIVYEKLTQKEKNEWVTNVASHLNKLLNRSDNTAIKTSDLIPHIINLYSFIREDGDSEDKLKLANVLFGYYLHFGVFSEAKQIAIFLLEASEKLYAKDSIYLAKIYHNLCILHANQGQFIEAKKYVKMAMNFNGLTPGNEVNYLNSLLNIERELGNFNEALSCYSKLSDIYREFPDDFEDHDLAGSVNSLGVVLSNMSIYDKAEECFREAIQYWMREAKPSYHYIANAYSNLGNVNRERGNKEEARRYYTKAIELNTKIFGEEHATISTDYGNIGLSYYEEYNFFYAKRYFRKALEINKLVFDEINAHNAILLNNIGMVEEANGKIEAAIKYYEESLLMFESLGNVENQDFANAYYNLGGAHHLLGNTETAESYLFKALKIDQAVYGYSHPEVAKDLGKIGAFMYDRNNISEAIKYLNESMKIYETINLTNSPDFVMSMCNLAIAYYHSGSIGRSKKLIDKSLTTSVVILGRNNPQQKIIYTTYFAMLIKLNAVEKEQKFIDLLIRRYEIEED